MGHTDFQSCMNVMHLGINLSRGCTMNGVSLLTGASPSFQSKPAPASPGVNEAIDRLPLGAQTLLSPKCGSTVNLNMPTLSGRLRFFLSSCCPFKSGKTMFLYLVSLV